MVAWFGSFTTTFTLPKRTRPREVAFVHAINAWHIVYCDNLRHVQYQTVSIWRCDMMWRTLFTVIWRVFCMVDDCVIFCQSQCILSPYPFVATVSLMCQQRQCFMTRSTHHLPIVLHGNVSMARDCADCARANMQQSLHTQAKGPILHNTASCLLHSHSFKYQSLPVNVQCMQH